MLGVREQDIGRELGRTERDVFDSLVRLRQMVPAQLVVGGVAHNAGQQRPVLSRVRQLALQADLQKLAEAIVHAVDGILGAEASLRAKRTRSRRCSRTTQSSA